MPRPITVQPSAEGNLLVRALFPAKLGHSCVIRRWHIGGLPPGLPPTGRQRMRAAGDRPRRGGGWPESFMGRDPSEASPSNPVDPAPSDRLLRVALLLRRVPGPLHVVSDGASVSTQGPWPALPPASGTQDKTLWASGLQMPPWRSLHLLGRSVLDCHEAREPWLPSASS